MTTDDEDAQDYVDVAALGTIEVRVFHGVLESLAQTPEGVNHVADVGVVSELSKKGGLHQTSLGPARFRQPVVSRKMMRVEPENRPFASFVFRHRPAATLQAMGIMAHPAPAAQQQAGPSNTKRERTQSPIASGSAKRRRTSHAAQDVITIEDSDDDAPRVKPERALSPIRVPAASVGETIDLTGDD
ncbi:hypothetical protein EWM64_g9090 [Hericium alpestre]|uniref:DUF7918 domain-containing protein n=1 Tax=Hericium alpestre TaxID=135208 RepID=A0A4Y9ZJM3_9AGAM|nr:hypothetical protein EWM64_g9090 [Hericium alpestre]